MKHVQLSFWDGFFAAFFVGNIAFWLLEEEKARKERSKALLDRLANSGIDDDCINLENDWRMVNADFQRAFEQLKYNQNKHESQTSTSTTGTRGH